MLCYGLRTDFHGELFLGAKALLGIVDALIELNMVRPCERDAAMNLRVDRDGAPVAAGDQAEIGGNERYAASCRHHFAAALGRCCGLQEKAGR